ncbi:MAG: MaoC family dehydratase N-terminal domain-containing protein [Dehalococcoidia bacterium]|nr:MaoC family dehydratase N-terminal domain-containing protein [Dehalococcoidia bacterium]
MDPEQSLITEEHRSLIGVKSVPVVHVLKASDVRQVREALHDTDPKWSEESGQAGPWALAILEPRPTVGLPDGAVPRVLPTGVLTQSEWTVHRPFKVGEELTATHSVADLRERLGGRFGRTILVLVRTEYRDAAGELVAETSHTVTQYDPKGAEAAS